MQVYIPHIHYTVVVKEREKHKGNHTGLALCERTDPNTSTIFMVYPIPKYSEPTLAHEIVHVLQNICEDRHMTFEKEQEHMGYLMQFLMNKILQYHYV